jgi:regulator of sigma E protease
VGKALNGVNPLSDLSGPVGIAKMVGSASQSGLDYFLFFVAILSVNLAVFNMLPIPALDGGRIIFVLFEAISRRKINTKVSYYLNLIGFVSLIVLLIATTISDIMR